MDYLDSYCERAGNADIWAEPLNAVTNLAFLIAALMMVQRLKGISFKAAPDVYFLCFTLGCIGVGSGLWHTYATPLTVILDVIPITIFINVYLGAFLWRGFGLTWWQVALALAGLQGLNARAGMAFIPSTLHGTIMYLPTYATLCLITLLAYKRRDWFSTELLFIVVLWTCSLIFRTIDVPFCQRTVIGTHYLWHLANAVVLYKLLSILLMIYQRK